MKEKYIITYNLEEYDKPIIVITDSKKKIDELQASNSDSLNKVAFVINNKESGVYIYGNQRLDVKTFESLRDYDISDYSFLIAADYYEELYYSVLKYKKGLVKSNIAILLNKEASIENHYRTKYKNNNLENIILFRSGPHANSYIKGMDFADNARALFEYMLEKKYNEKYELVWLVKSPSDYEFYRDNYKNISFIAYDWSISDDLTKRNEYYRVMCLAKYIFMTDAYGFCRNAREDQIRIQLWHGCGFKTRVNFDSCEHRYEYNIVISDVYKQVHKKIYGLRDDQVIITGYPKQDWLRKPYEKSISKLFGVRETKKCVFWLPTFRMADDRLKALNQYNLSTETGIPIVETYEQLELLNAILGDLDIMLVIKFHPFVNKNQAKQFDYSNIIGVCNEFLVDNDLVINRLLASADALISDYSSAAVDFLALDRPIAFTLDDVEEYTNSRGFVFEQIRDWLPGMEIFKFEDLVRYIKEIGYDIDSTREKRFELTQKMNYYQDNQNCQRVIDAFGI